MKTKAIMVVPDGYNGRTVELSLHPCELDGNSVKLWAVGRPYLIRWVRVDEWLAAGGA
jgi:hypothetical protein